MVIAQCDVWWADLAEPIGSAPGYRRPVVVVQADPLNRSQLKDSPVNGTSALVFRLMSDS